ncbi:MAG: ABC transporter ATP-binding protein [Blastocatellia bacterium]
MLEAVNLTKDYGSHRALDALNLTISPGEIYCLLGANGAGKTTTIHLFLHFIEPTSGTARIQGLDVTQAPLETKRFLAYIPENVTLYQHLTGLENLAYFSALGGRQDLSHSRMQEILAEVGLPPEVAEKRLSTYSKGMRQKVGIAMAIAREASVLLLDEPTSGLDPKASNEFSLLLQRMSERGVAVLMATHDLFRARESGTRIGIMRQGKLVADLAAASVSHTELEEAYLAAVS